MNFTPTELAYVQHQLMLAVEREHQSMKAATGRSEAVQFTAQYILARRLLEQFSHKLKEGPPWTK